MKEINTCLKVLYFIKVKSVDDSNENLLPGKHWTKCWEKLTGKLQKVNLSVLNK